MLCDKCGIYAAEIHYKQIENGVQSEMHLCPFCAAELGIGGGILSGTGLFSALFGTPATPSVIRECPLCKSSFSDLCASGMAGCPECYTFFGEELAPSIASMHGRASHRGRLPKMPSAAPADPIATLEAELAKAIEAQEYEKAAELRDQIKAKKEEKHDGR